MKYILNTQQYKSLNESLSSAKKIFVDTNAISSDIFNKLAEGDPSSTKKYLDVMCAYFLKDKTVTEIINTIKQYDELCTRNMVDNKDIRKFTKYEDLVKYIDENKNKVSPTQYRKLVKRDQSEVIVDDDDFLIISPLSHKASCIFGAHTKWCTTSKDPEKWNEYTNDEFVKFYYIINKQLDIFDDMYKTAVAVYPDGHTECYDAKDKPIDFYEIEEMGLTDDIFSPREISQEQHIEQILGSSEKSVKWSRDDKGRIDVDGNVFIDGYHGDVLPFEFGEVKGNFKIVYSDITSCTYFPYKVGGRIEISNCELHDVSDFPIKCKCPDLDLSNCKISDLSDFPVTEVYGDFNISGNQLSTLEGCPKFVYGSFDCSYNNLNDLDGGPKYVEGDYTCFENDVEFIEEDVYDSCDEVKGMIYL